MDTFHADGSLDGKVVLLGVKDGAQGRLVFFTEARGGCHRKQSQQKASEYICQ